VIGDELLGAREIGPPGARGGEHHRKRNRLTQRKIAKMAFYEGDNRGGEDAEFQGVKMGGQG